MFNNRLDKEDGVKGGRNFLVLGCYGLRSGDVNFSLRGLVKRRRREESSWCLENGVCS